MGEASKEPGALRRWLSLGAKLGLTALVVWVLLRGLDLGRLGALLGRADLLLIGFAVLYTVVLNAIKPVRWLWLLRPVLPEASYPVALRSLLVGAAARLVLPSKVGELARVLEVPRLPLLRGVGLTVLDLLMELTAAFLVAIPGALIFAGPELAAAFVLLTLLPLAALLWPHRALFPLSRLPGLGGLGGRIEGIREVVGLIGKGVLLRGVGLSVLLNGIRFGQLYLLFVALGLVPGAAAVLCFPLVQLADGFPLTVGGVGVREWLSVQVLPRFGILPEAAVAAVFLQFVISNVIPGAVGGALLLRSRSAVRGRLREAMNGLRKGGRDRRS
jgi:uncharacterized membrane protein YbhN (UPF0104 family)